MIPAIFFSALALGFLGSFHCIGMCGPITLSLPVQHLQGMQKAAGIGLYNAGRILTYSLLGIVFGFIGLSFQYFGWQQWLSIILGIILIILFVLKITSFKTKKYPDSFSSWNKKIISLLAPLLSKPKKRNLILIGALNGLLPCGLVYIALAGAIATGNILQSALFMAGFGAGTLPAMAIASYAAGIISLQTRNIIRKVLPYMLCIMGILLILRGMGLGIPFISPHVAAGNAIECH